MIDLLTSVQLALDPAALMRRCGLDPDDWQADLLRSQPKRALLLCCRQSGKSTTTAVLGLHRAVFDPGALVLLLSASQDQSSELLRRVRTLFEAADVGVESVGDSKRLLELGNGSRVLSLPASPDGVRGYSADLVVADEASFLDLPLYQAILPTLAATNGDLIALTTPKGRTGFFFQEWTDNAEHWHRVKVTADECPRIAAEFLEGQRRMLGERAYRQEYECVFEDATAAAFSSSAIRSAFRGTDSEALFDGAFFDADVTQSANAFGGFFNDGAQQ